MSPLSFCDRVKCSRTLQSTTASICGIIGSLACIAVGIWMYIFLIFAYTERKYQQSFFETPFSGTETMITSKNIKLAAVLTNKTSNTIANHTFLRTSMRPRIFQSNQNGAEVNFEPADYCDSQYFMDAVNPIELTDCFLFTPDRLVEFSFNPSATIQASTIGFSFTYNCLNPFFCKIGGSALNTVQSNLLSIFTNFHVNLYFSVERLQPDGSIKHQVFQISSGEFTNSIGVAASINAELNLNRVRVDESIMPWNSIATYNLLEYSGLVKGSTKAASAVYTPLPTYNIVSSNFQTIIYKYGLKLDWLIGIIGGGFFINYIICVFLCFHYNQSFYRIRAAEQLILVGQKKQEGWLPLIQKVSISKWYFLTRFSPCYQNAAMKELTNMLDISRLIKKLKLASRNVKRYNDKNDIKIEDPQTLVDYREKKNPLQEENKLNYHDVEEDEQYKKKIEENSQLLGIHPQGLKALQSKNASRIYSKSLTALYYNEDKREFKHIKKIQSYQDQPEEVKPSCMSQILNFLKKFDCYSIPISFDSSSQSSTIFGTILTLFVLIAPILLLYRRVSTDSFQIHNSKQIMEGNEIDYTLTTGSDFRPAVCFTQSTISYYLEGSYKTVNLNFFTYTQQLGYKFVGAKRLQTGMNDFLGITQESTKSKLDTSLCYVMPDDIEVAMKGKATGDQAFFGYQLSGYCSGTPSYCQSQQNITNFNFNYFLADTLNIITLYLPLNQYDETKQTVLSGNVYANQMREGKAGFSVTGSIEQTVYVDRIQLLDGKSRQFVGKQAKIIQDTIFSSRYSLNQNTKQIENTTISYYETRIRPSDRITKVYMIGVTTQSIIAYIGGSIFLAYIAFTLIGRPYSAFVRIMRMAYMLYHDEIINKVNIFHQILHVIPFFPLRIFCCGNCGYSSRRMREMQAKIKRDTNVVKVVRMVDICQKLAASLTNNTDVSQLSRVFLKQRISKSKQITLYHKSQKQQKYDDNQDTKQPLLQQGKNKIVNIDTEKQLQDDQPQQQEQEQEQLNLKQHQQQILRSQSLQRQRNIIKPQQPYQYKVPNYCLGNGCFLDFFQMSAQLSFKNQWRIRSVFGFILTIISILFTLLLFSAYKGDYNQARISSTKGIPANLDLISTLSLNHSNFRIALGFIQKPSFQFKNVSSLITDQNTSLLGASVIQFSQVWLNSTLYVNQTRHNLVACPENYFDDFYSQNQDKQYFESYRNGFCLPPNITLELAPERQNNTHFFRFTVYPISASGNTVLNTLMTSYVLGMYMTIPRIDQKKKKIYYSVQQIKPNTETLTRAYDVNVTLTKQKVTFTSPNYTVNHNSSVLQTYNYLENRNYERVNINNPTANPKISNITFSYSGLEESYQETYPHFAEAYGVLGGIILVVFYTIGIIGHSFNNYLKHYLIGRQHYIPFNRHANYYNQFDVFVAWFLSFIATCSKDYKFNKKLLNIHSINYKIKRDLNFFEFLRKIQEIKYLINKLSFNLQNNPRIPLYNIQSKTIIFKNNNKKFRRQVLDDEKEVSQNFGSRDEFRIDYCEKYYNVHFRDLIEPQQLRQNYKLPKEAEREENPQREKQQPLRRVQIMEDQISYISEQEIKLENIIVQEDTPHVPQQERQLQPMIHNEYQHPEYQIQTPPAQDREIIKKDRIQEQSEIKNNKNRQNSQFIQLLDSRSNMLQQQVEPEGESKLVNPPIQESQYPDLQLTNKNSEIGLMNIQDFGGQQGI